MTATYGYSIGPEPKSYTGRYGTAEAALRDALEAAKDVGERYVWMHRLEPWRPEMRDIEHAAECLLDSLDESAGNAGVCDAGGCWILLNSISNESIRELESKIESWVSKQVSPTLVVVESALYVDGKWMPAGYKFVGFGTQLKHRMKTKADLAKLELNNMAAQFIAMHLPGPAQHPNWRSQHDRRL